MFDISISLSPTKTKFGPLLFSGNLDEGLKNVKDLGYQGVELSLLDSKNIDQHWLADRLKELNLNVFAVATGQSYYTDGCSLYSIEEDKREKTIERIKSHIDFASKLNAMVIIGGIRGRISEENKKRHEQEADGKLALNECVKYAQKKKTILLLEPINRYETNLINTLQEGIELIDGLGVDNLKLLPDTFHMNIEEKSIEESLIKAKDYIGYIHFADSNRWAPGSGHINFKHILSILVKINYRNAIGIEVLPKPDDYQAAKNSIEFLATIYKKLGRDID